MKLCYHKWGYQGPWMRPASSTQNYWARVRTARCCWPSTNPQAESTLSNSSQKYRGIQCRREKDGMLSSIRLEWNVRTRACTHTHASAALICGIVCACMHGGIGSSSPIKCASRLCARVCVCVSRSHFSPGSAVCVSHATIRVIPNTGKPLLCHGDRHRR